MKERVDGGIRTEIELQGEEQMKADGSKRREPAVKDETIFSGSEEYRRLYIYIWEFPAFLCGLAFYSSKPGSSIRGMEA